MAVDAQHPGNIGRDLLFQLDQCVRHLVEFGAAFGLEIGLAGVEEHLGLQHETVADHTHVRAVTEDLTKLAKEIGTVALQFVDTIRPEPD